MIKIILVLLALLFVYYIFLFLWNTLKNTQNRRLKESQDLEMYSFETDKEENLIDVEQEELRLRQKREEQKHVVSLPLKEQQQKKEEAEQTEKKIETIQTQLKEDDTFWKQLVTQLTIQVRDLKEENEKLKQVRSEPNSQNLVSEAENENLYVSGLSLSEFFAKGIDEIHAENMRDLSYMSSN